MIRWGIHSHLWHNRNLSSSPGLSMDFDLRGLLRRVAEEVEAEIRQVEKELAETRRVGARAEELSAIRDILYEDKWFRVATAVYAHLKKLFAEDRKAGELLEAAYISPPALRICQSTCTTFTA